MSYSSDVKSEICSNAEARSCCDKALLNSAVSFFNTVNSKKMQFRTSSQATAIYLYALINDLTGVSFDITRSGAGYVLTCEDENDIHKVALTAGMINKTTNQISAGLNGSFSVNECCQRSALKGAFITAGYVASPHKSYHLEITSHRKKLLEQTLELLTGQEIEAKLIKRNSRYVLYLKEKEQISDMLSLLGATKMFFEYQEVILEKELKNSLNRKQNFEQANLDKTVNAAVQQCAAIAKIRKKGKFGLLSGELQEAAILRENNPALSLEGLALLSSDKVSRSGMNHRLKKIVALGNSL